jgi:hypothetical protein
MLIAIPALGVLFYAQAGGAPSKTRRDMRPHGPSPARPTFRRE